MKLDQLAYIVIGTSKIDEWRDFGANVLGTMVEDGPDGSLYLRYDEWHYRVLCVPDEREHLRAAGWSLRSRSDFLAAREEAKAAGVEIEEGDRAACALRMVKEFFTFTDPNGTAHEVCWGRSLATTPFVSPVGVGRFVTGDLGMGHVVIPSDRNFDECIAFYENVMGLNYSDFFTRAVGDRDISVYFFHCDNGRQHSLALAQMHQEPGINHFLVEVGSLDDVGRALDRARKNGTPVVRGLGRHVNDSVVSFYLLTPGGFHIEYGTGGEVMDWSAHEVANIPWGTHWGHEWNPEFDPARRQ